MNKNFRRSLGEEYVGLPGPKGKGRRRGEICGFSERELGVEDIRKARAPVSWQIRKDPPPGFYSVWLTNQDVSSSAQ